MFNPSMNVLQPEYRYFVFKELLLRVISSLSLFARLQLIFTREKSYIVVQSILKAIV